VVDLRAATHKGSSKNTVTVAIVVLLSAGSIALRWTTGSVSDRRRRAVRQTGGAPTINGAAFSHPASIVLAHSRLHPLFGV